MASRLRSIYVLLAVLLMAPSLGAQQITGRVTDQNSGQPMAAVQISIPGTGIGALSVASVASPPARRLLATVLAAYAGVALAAARNAARGRDPGLTPRIAAVFPALHLGYGVGMIRGLSTLLGVRERTERAATSSSPTPARRCGD